MHEEMPTPGTATFRTDPAGDGRAALLELSGDIDLASTGRLEPMINAYLSDHRHADLVVDMSNVTFLDSAGIMLLMSTDALVPSMHLRAVPRFVRRVIDLCGLAETLPITP